MKAIYIVAHPEASHHTAGVVGGWYDSVLTERGIRHARDIAQALTTRLDGKPVEILSSDLRRAKQTADMIGQALGTGVTTDRDLREKSFGEAEGKPQDWLRARDIPLPDNGERLHHDEGVEGAETRWQLAERSYRAMDRIIGSLSENHVVVTHGGPTTLLIAAWIGMPIQAAGRVQFPVRSGSITWLRKDPRNFSHQLAQLNDISHLSRG